MSKKVQISYGEYGRLVKKLTSDIVEYMGDTMIKHFDYIYGVNRGGLPIAVHLSHFLGKPINTESNLDIKPYSLLVVDDIVDTGETMIKLKWISKYTASLFYKPHSKFKPNFYVKETTDWIVFPWEKIEETPNREQYKNLK